MTLFLVEFPNKKNIIYENRISQGFVNPKLSNNLRKKFLSRKENYSEMKEQFFFCWFLVLENLQHWKFSIASDLQLITNSFITIDLKTWKIWKLVIVWQNYAFTWKKKIIKLILGCNFHNIVRSHKNVTLIGNPIF